MFHQNSSNRVEQAMLSSVKYCRNAKDVYVILSLLRLFVDVVFALSCYILL